MEIVIRKMGNSTGMAFPPSVLKDLGLKAGQVMTLDTKPDGTITLVPKRKYKLSEMITQCDLKAPPPADLAAWDQTPRVGIEVL